MINKWHCLEALRNGKALVNVHNGTVIEVFGKQFAIGLGRSRNGRAYSFSSPIFWRVKELTLWQKLQIMWKSEVK